MTTTTHPKLTVITALRDKARATTFEAEATALLEKARALCAKYDIDPAVVDAPTEQLTARKTINGQAQPQNVRRYSCRFGCGFFVSHTIDELHACAEKARNANNGNAYTAPKSDPFSDLFGQARDYGTYGGFSEDKPKARTHGSHANCDHEATKSARARCRRERGF